MDDNMTHSHDPPLVARRLLSVTQASAYLGVSKWTVYDLIRDGLLTCIRLGKRILIDRKDLDDFIESHKE